MGRNWMMGIATAGHSAIGDVTALRIISEAKQRDDFADAPAPLLERVLLKIYKRYIFPRDERRQTERWTSLIIGILADTGEKFLFKTFDEIVKPQPHYACAGSGQDVAHYFLDRLYGDGLKGSEALVLNAFVIREAKASVGGVGRESEFVKFMRDKDGHHIATRTLMEDAVWRQLPHLSHCLKPFWTESKP
jgi:20S proteasome alpha/beta subunit